MSEILIGTSGYDYPEWKGVFYPEKLKRTEFLEYYATKFNAVELNNTFYSMPTNERLFKFYERTHGSIKFSIKANRLLTHEVGSDWRTNSTQMRDALSALKEKDVLSTTLFQFPQSFHYTDSNRIYLSNLINEFKDFSPVIEFRHRDWIRESVFEGLDKRGAGIVFCDFPELKYLPSGMSKNDETANDRGTGCLPFVGQNAYIRMHGRNAEAWYAENNENNGSARYLYDYSDEELLKFIPVINAGVVSGKQVSVFFNNHPNGNGVKNASKIKKMIEKIIKK